MNKEEYFAKSQKQNLPFCKCPIVERCARRLSTIYLFNEMDKSATSHDPLDSLIKDGTTPPDIRQNLISMIGEAPQFSKSPSYISFKNTCPEVSLFDADNSFGFAKGTACTSGNYDSEYKKTNIREEKHFTECDEYNHHVFETKYHPHTATRSPKSKQRRIGISKQLRFEIFQRDKFKCTYCNRGKAEDGVKLELDHVIPVVKGGTTEFSNLTTACSDCNQGKLDKTI